MAEVEATADEPHRALLTSSIEDRILTMTHDARESRGELVNKEAGGHSFALSLTGTILPKRAQDTSPIPARRVGL